MSLRIAFLWAALSLSFVTPGYAIGPASPTAFGITPTNDTTPTWLWSSGGGGNCTFSFKLDDDDLSTGATVTTGSSFTPEEPLPEGPHTVYVQEQDDAGNWSDVSSFSIFIDPTALAPSTIDTTLAWDESIEPNITITGYKLYYKTGRSGPPYDGTGALEGNSSIDVGNVLEYPLHALSGSEIYFFAVTACNTSSPESDYSDEVFLVPAILSDTESDSQFYTNKVTVNVTLAGVPCNAAEMILAEDVDFSINSTGWKPFVPESNFTFSDATEGTKTLFVKIRDTYQNEVGWAKGRIMLDTGLGSDVTSDDSGCLVASVAFGSNMDRHVKILSQFRDKWLANNRPGQAFSALYDTYSPTIANFLSRHPSVKAAVRCGLIVTSGVAYLALYVHPVALLFAFILLLLIAVYYVRRLQSSVGETQRFPFFGQSRK